MDKEDLKKLDCYIDMKEIGNLRNNRLYEEVYNIMKEKNAEFPDNDFLLSQYLISLVDFKPYATDEIKEVSEKLLLTKNKKHAYYGYVIYYLSKNNVEEAYEYYKLIENDDFLVKLVDFKMSYYKCSKVFRKMTFNVDRNIQLISNPHMSVNRYIRKTFDIAEYYHENKQYADAIKYYKLSCEKRQRNQQALCYLGMGRCYYHLSNYNDFQSNFKLALEIAKENDSEQTKDSSAGLYYKILYQYIYCLNDFNQFDEAYNLTKVLDTGTEKDKAMSLYLKGKIAKNTGNYDEAIKIFEKLASTDKDNRRHSLSELVRVYSIVADQENAKKYLNILYEEYPDYSPSLRLSYLYDFMMNEECIECAKKYINSKYDAEAKYYIGRALCRERRYEEAEGYFEDIKTKITKAPLNFELGLISEKLGKYDKAYDYYNNYINLCYKRYDKKLLNKGINTMIEFLNNQYDFEAAISYIRFYQSVNPDDEVQINLYKAMYYYRKQDYAKAEEYFKKLYGTEKENDAKNYLVVLYRYSNETDKANLLIDELESTEFYSQEVFNRAKQLKDKHDEKSLDLAYNYLLSIHDDDIKTMVVMEKLQILLKLEKYDLAEDLLEKTYYEHSISRPEYVKFKQYILCKKGRSNEIDSTKDYFINYVIKYNEMVAVDNIIHMNNSNRGAKYGEEYADDYNENRKVLFLTDDEMKELFNKVKAILPNSNYFMHDLYDVYIIEMEDIIGQYYGIDTKYIEVRCEQNTHNIHMIQPTLKKLNINKINSSKTRKKTDLGQN